MTFLSNNSNNALLDQSNSTIKPLYQTAQYRPISIKTFLSQSNKSQPNQETKKKENKPVDGIDYTIDFKKFLRVKDVIKELRTIYGPVFVACHIALSLCSLGFFCSLVMLSVDLSPVIGMFTKLQPEDVFPDSTLSSYLASGGKFAVAYAIHKTILPLRLVGSVFLTRIVSKIIKARKALKK